MKANEMSKYMEKNGTIDVSIRAQFNIIDLRLGPGWGSGLECQRPHLYEVAILSKGSA